MLAAGEAQEKQFVLIVLMTQCQGCNTGLLVSRIIIRENVIFIDHIMGKQKTTRRQYFFLEIAKNKQNGY